MPNPIFLFGFPRSGTTLVRALLGAHSRISLVNEPELVWALRRSGVGVADRVAPGELPALIERLCRTRPCREHIARNAVALRELCAARDALSFREIFERLLPRPADATQIWGEKSLNDLFYTRELAALYPGCLLIHIVRDPRAVARSRAEKRSAREARAPRSALRSAWSHASDARLWSDWMAVARAAQRALRGARWFELRYEELLAEPVRVLRSLCTAIGVEYEQQMLDPAARAADPVLQTQAAFAHERISQPLDPRRAAAARTAPAALAWIVEREAAAAMRELGYEPTRPALPCWQTPALRLLCFAAGRWRSGKQRAHFAQRGIGAAELSAARSALAASPG